MKKWTSGMSSALRKTRIARAWAVTFSDEVRKKRGEELARESKVREARWRARAEFPRAIGMGCLAIAAFIAGLGFLVFLIKFFWRIF